MLSGKEDSLRRIKPTTSTASDSHIVLSLAYLGKACVALSVSDHSNSGASAPLIQGGDIRKPLTPDQARQGVLIRGPGSEWGLHSNMRISDNIVTATAKKREASMLPSGATSTEQGSAQNVLQTIADPSARK